MVSTGQCPACHATNSLAAMNCLECRKPLPWADTVAEAQRKREAATTPSVVMQSTAITGEAIPESDEQPLSDEVSTSPFQVFSRTFLGPLARPFDDLDPLSAAWFGMLAIVICNICLVAGFRMLLLQFTSLLHSVVASALTGTDAASQASGVDVMGPMKWSLVALIPCLTIAASCTLIRTIFGGARRFPQGDLFVAGSSMLPVSFFILAAGFLGFNHWKIIAVLLALACCYTVILFFRGLTMICKVRDAVAAFCVPLVLTAGLYFTQAVFLRLLYI